MTDFSYSVQTSRYGKVQNFSLAPDRLTWTGRRPGSISYQTVNKIRVYQVRFWGSSKLYWTCILHAPGGLKIHLSAAHRMRSGAVEDRTAAYIPFIKELEARIIASNKDAVLIVERSWLSKFENVVGWLVVKIMRVMRRFDCDRTANLFAKTMRKIGPRLRGHRTARAQLKLAFPGMTAEELEKILDGMWDNIARVAAEYAHLDELWDFDPTQPKSGRILIDRIVGERLLRLGHDRGPALMFGAHLANWELLGLAATAYGRDIVLVYREPKIPAITNEIVKIRGSGVAGLIPAGPTAPLKVRNALRRNNLVGMLVDQYDANGVEVSFFDRRCRVNSTLGRIARLFECPIYGARVVRLPDRRYNFEMTEPLTPPRDQEGKIDVIGTMQMVTSIIEGWVREYPEQWMWTHRRWR